MTDLIVRENNLPTTLEDLSKFVLVGRDKLQAVRAEISALKKLNVAQDVLEQKRVEQADIGAVVLLAEMKCGELLNLMPKAKENQYTKSATSHREEKALDESGDESPKPKLEVAKEMGFNKNQVSQFQTLADNPDIVHKTITDAVGKGETPTRAKALENIQQTKKPHVSFNSGNNEWYTPADIIETARKVFTITLDPASSAIANETVKAKTFYTADDDGLIQNWDGENIWLNPPYASGLIEKFVDKLLASDFCQAIVLVNNATDTEWFFRLANRADAIVFPKGRIKFHKPDGSTGAPLQGQAILYFGDDINNFKKHFEQYGKCWQ